MEHSEEQTAIVERCLGQYLYEEFMVVLACVVLGD